MFKRLNIFAILLFFLVNSLAFAKYDEILQHKIAMNDRQSTLKDLSALIIIDKQKELYHETLVNINPYPNIDFKHKSKKYLSQFDNFIRSLMPYILIKLKNKDINGELPTLFKAINLAKKMDQNLKITSLEKATFDFLLQSLQTENVLRACGQMMSRYADKQKEIEIHLDRIEPNLNQRVVKDLKKIEKDLYLISSDLKGAIEK